MVKLFPCDHEVTGSSPINNLLQKYKERLGTIDLKWSDPSQDPVRGTTCIGPTCKGHMETREECSVDG